ncbi:MAG: Flp pilus assembly complex ATPase component TadA [Candidatus Omnitrophica bacterium]|nr:Flp pilus assembly complex ATPase component TadA [Candidatus Omnitrophota bacterium]
MAKLGTLKKKLNEILLENKLISEKDLKKALEIQKEKGGQLSKILVEQNMISQKELMVCLGEQLGIPPINLTKYKIDPEVIKLIPERVARHYLVIPVSKIKNLVSVAMADPLNIFALDDIKALTKAEVQTMVTTSDDIIQAIDKYYGVKAQEMSEIIEKAQKETELETVEEEETDDTGLLVKASKEAPVVKLVDVIINEALKNRASDIHLEPYINRVRIRYRIDGVMHEFFTLPKKVQNALIARLKIMSNLDITQRRIPQDGRFKVKTNEKEIDFRVSVLPTAFGGKIVLRALDKANLSIGLDKLGFLPGPLTAFKEAIAKPYGMILLTGPTGCGKSTTLYSILNQLNTTDKNIVTIEDPVEYQIERITQIPVKAEIGLTFANGLRSVLRQSPDVIMVGEIRDGETADIAIKAALTGEVVLSTLHTNDAASAITRLIDMGVEPFLIASSVILVAAQRLCRRVCEYCKEPYEESQEILDNLGLKLPKGTKVYRSKGCARCNHTGYHGRMGTLETLTIDDTIRELIIKGASSNEIKDYARKQGMKTLRENGLEKFVRGETTLEEVLRMTAEE